MKLLLLSLVVLISASAASRAEDAAPKGKALPRFADLACKVEKPTGSYPGDLNGMLDIDALTLDDSRSGRKSSFLAAKKEDDVVDGRCGKLLSPLDANYNYEVTPRGYWGQDILQIPRSALSGYGPSKFKAYLHTCQYDGEWHADWDYVLDCTLTAR